MKSRFNCLNGSERRKLTKKQALAARQRDQSGRPKSANQSMKNKLKSVRRGSKSASAPQPKTARAVAFRVQVQGPAEVFNLQLDDWQSEVMRRAAGSARISLEEMFHFIFFRQLESFCGEHETYTVCGDAHDEVSLAIDNGVKYGRAIEANAELILESLDALKNNSALHAQVSAAIGLIRKMALRVGNNAIDAKHHWYCSIVPALLERKTPPGAQAPLPTTERRAA